MQYLWAQMRKASRVTPTNGVPTATEKPSGSMWRAAIPATVFTIWEMCIRDRKELDLDREMTDALVKLYEKYVPAPVREYIDESDVSAAAPSKPRRSPRTAAPKPDQEPEVIP